MPKYHIENHTVTLKDSTRRIIRYWHESLCEVGLIRARQIKESGDATVQNAYPYERIEGSSVRDSLLFTSGVAKKETGVARVGRLFKSIFDGSSGERSTLTHDEINIADSDMLEFFRHYQTQLNTIIKKIPSKFTKPKVNDKELGSEKLNDPYVLVSELLQRIVLVIISKEKLSDTDHDKYFKAIDFFVKKLCDESKLFTVDGRYDAFALFLRQDQPSEFLENFQFYVEHQKKRNLHLDTIARMGDYLLLVEKIINKQLVAYWNPTVEVYSLKDSTFLTSLQEIEGDKCQRALKKLAKAEKKASKSKKNNESVAEYVPTGLPNTSHEDKMIAVARITSNPMRAHLILLYNLRVRLQKIKQMHRSVSELFSSASWLAMFFLKVGEFARFLNEFQKENEDIINIKGKLNHEDKAHTALLKGEANSIFHLRRELKTLDEQAKQIDHPKHQIQMIRDLTQTISCIMSAQQEFNLRLIDPASAAQFCRQLEPRVAKLQSSMSRFELLEEGQGSESSQALLELPPARRQTPQLLLEEGRPSESSHTVQEDRPSESSNPPGRSSIIMEDLPEKTQILAPETEMPANFYKAYAYLKNKSYLELQKYCGDKLSKDPREWRFMLSKLIDTEGKTLLHHMLCEADYENIKWLLDNYVDIFSSDSSGTSALKLAASFILRNRENNKDLEVFHRMCKTAKILCQSSQIGHSDTTKVTQQLSDFCALATKELSEEFYGYTVIQRERFDSALWEVKRKFKNLFGFDFTVERAEELAEAFAYLYELTQKNDIASLQDNMKRIMLSQKLASGSTLHVLLQRMNERLDDISTLAQYAYSQVRRLELREDTKQDLEEDRIILQETIERKSQDKREKNKTTSVITDESKNDEAFALLQQPVDIKNSFFSRDKVLVGSPDLVSSFDDGNGLPMKRFGV